MGVLNTSYFNKRHDENVENQDIGNEIIHCN